MSPGLHGLAKTEERSEGRRYYPLEMFTRPNASRSLLVRASQSLRSRAASILIGMAVLVPLPGCMTEAWDGYEVTSITDQIPFKGFHPSEGEEITVEAWDYYNEMWKPVAWAIADEPVALDDNLMLFRWKTEAKLDHVESNHAVFWDDAGLCKGRKARVRAVETDTGRALLGSRENGGDCALENPSLKDWQDNCLAENSPVSEIFTADAKPLPEVDIDLTWLNPAVSGGECAMMWIQATGFETAFEGAEVLAKVYANVPGASTVWYECDPLMASSGGGFMTMCKPPEEWPYKDPYWMAANQDKISVEYRVGFECNYGSTMYSSTGFRQIWPQETGCGDSGVPDDMPPPPTGDSGTVWSYTCNCVTLHCDDKNHDGVCDDPQQPDPYEYFDLHTSTCFSTPSGTLPGGIGWMCTNASGWLEYDYGLQHTECSLAASPAPAEGGSCTGPYGTYLSSSVTL